MKIYETKNIPQSVVIGYKCDECKQLIRPNKSIQVKLKVDYLDQELEFCRTCFPNFKRKLIDIGFSELDYYLH